MKNLILFIILLVSLPTFCQYSFEGIVIDENKEPMPFANISLKAESNQFGATTGLEGQFKIVNIPANIYTLKISYIGYISKEFKTIDINKNYIDTIQLSPSQQVIEELIVGAYKIPIIEETETTSSSITTSNYLNLRGSRRTSNVYVKGSRGQEQYFSPLPDLAYLIKKEEGFTLSSNENTSTFSIDVDNASYTHMRNTILKKKQIPKAGNIRIEEMLNYFDYDYSEPTKGETFSVYNELGNCPWNNKAKLLHIGIQGKRIDYKDLDNSNLVFLIDVSGSMSNSLSLIKKSLSLLVDKLNKKDKISIVVYAGAAGEVLGATSANEKHKIKNAINNLKAGGSTAGGAGIELAYKIAKKNFIKDGNNRVILCTDGDFNVGISSRKDLINLIEKKRKEKVFLSVCGFGKALKRDKEMESIADKGNGNYYYIDNEKEAKKVFVTQMRATLFTIAKDFKIQMVFDEDVVHSYRLIGYTNRKLNNEDFKNDKKDAGELGAGQTVTALYELVLRDTITENDLAMIRLRFKKPNNNKSELSEFSIPYKLIDNSKTSSNFNFSATVASFGLMLEKTETKSPVSISEIISRAQTSISKKDNENRNEFISILESYSTLTK